MDERLISFPVRVVVTRGDATGEHGLVCGVAQSPVAHTRGYLIRFDRPVRFPGGWHRTGWFSQESFRLEQTPDLV